MAATAENHAMEGKGSGRHVMLALDESKYAEDVLRFCAENFAKIKGNKITFLYVYEYTPMTLLPGPGFVPAGCVPHSFPTPVIFLSRGWTRWDREP